LRSFLYERSNLTSTLEQQEASEYGAQTSAQHITSAETQTKTADTEALHEAEKGPTEPCGTVDPRLSAHQRLHELTKFVGNSLDCERFIQGQLLSRLERATQA
uniref:Androgen receptor n=1 Tax=Gongylonema pulchrum TaxID=637853 RepID=A0A183F131_9BILA